MTISYAIGRNSAEGRTHTMCIEGTHGNSGLLWGPWACLQSLCGWKRPARWRLELAQTLGLAQSALYFTFHLGCENPKPSLTELLVLEHGLYAGDPVSKVLLKPLTGTSRAGVHHIRKDLEVQALWPAWVYTGCAGRADSKIVAGASMYPGCQADLSS